MIVNYGSVIGQVVEYGYTGAYAGGAAYLYQLTAHIADENLHPNSVLNSANFATTDTPVEFRIISDFDSAKVVFNWKAFSDQQLWGQDVNTLAAVTVASTVDTTDTATIGWRTSDGTEGQFTATVNIAEATDNGGGTVTIGTSLVPRRIGNRKAARQAVNQAVYQAIYRS